MRNHRGFDADRTPQPRAAGRGLVEFHDARPRWRVAVPRAVQRRVLAVAPG